MTDQVRIVVAGGSGRMGRMLIRQVLETPGATLHAVTERPGHDWIGEDVGAAVGLGRELGVAVSDDPLEAFLEAHAAIDFTAPDPVCHHAEIAAQAKCVHVIGATGFGPEHLRRIAASARHAVSIRAGNMSLGVNLLTLLAKQVARALDAEFDIEIVEAHHNQKADAPSGTALMLGEAAAQGRGATLDALAERGRDGITGPREPGRIGFHAIRGGDVVGEHDVIFAAPGERIVLRHIATDRRIFARGAVKAALWGVGRRPGAYDMLDVLGLAEHR